MHVTGIPTPLSGARFGVDRRPSTTHRLDPVRTGPGSTQGRSLSRWPDGVPVELLDGSAGVELPPPLQRRLGRVALALWERLVELRGDGSRWLVANHEQLASRAGCSVRTVKRTMQRLAGAGLVQRIVTRIKGPKGWKSALRVRVWGALDGCRMVVPSGVINWCVTHCGWGGDRKSKMALQSLESADLATSKQVVSPSSWPVIYPCIEGNTSSLGKPNEDATGQGRQRPLFMIDQRSVPTSPLTPPKLKGEPDHPPTRYQWLRQLCQAYNAAHEKRFGFRGFYKLPTDNEEPKFTVWDHAAGAPVRPNTPTVDTEGKQLEQWKHYKRLWPAALALHEHDIPPQVWAEWVMGQWEKPRNIVACFVASQVHDRARRAIFRKESGYGHGAGALQFSPQQVHLEQMYRMRERDRLQRKREDGTPMYTPGTSSLGLPVWYHELRQEEVKQGVTDPMERFPQAGKGGGGW